MSWHNGELLAYDCETTGVNVEQDRIVTASVVRVSNDHSVKVLSWIVNPGVDIPESATKIHGVSNSYVVDHGDAPEKVLPLIVEQLEEGTPKVVFNAQFDMTILDRELRRHNICRHVWGLEFWPIIDPFVIDKHCDPYRKGKRTLKDTCKHYDIKEFANHQAGADALAAARLAWKLAYSWKELAESHPNEIHQWQKNWYKEQGESLRIYFTKTMNSADNPDDIIKLSEKIASLNDEWPLRTYYGK